jgi:uncharacterized repeat protein (TIGR01451 family)
MSLLNLSRELGQSRTLSSRRNRQSSRRLALAPFADVERLEERTLLSVGSIWYVNASAAPGGDGTSSGTAFQTIQAGVDAASSGDTVQVAAGNYNEGVTIPATDSNLTLLGAQHGVDARTRSGAESIVNFSGGAFGIHASGVVLDGFTIEGESNGSIGPGYGYGVYLVPGTTGTQILNDIVQNNISGIALSNTGAQQVKIQDNLFQNDTVSGPNSGSVIYADQYTAGGPVSNVLIDSNMFTNSAFVENSWPVGMSNTDFAHPFTNFTISNNVVTNSGRGFYFYDTTNVNITNNQISGATHFALGLFDGDSNYTVTNNYFTGSGRGVEFGDEYGNPDSNVAINDNAIVNNTTNALDFTDISGTTAYSGTLDASANYWGSSDPSTVAGLFTFGATGTSLANIDFTPLLDNPGTHSAPGYQPDLSSVTVHTLGAQTSGGRIQEGIDLVTTGGTVNVAAGTYNETDVINKSLTLLGANAGVHPAVGNDPSSSVGTRGAETILSHDGFYAIQPNADNITIDGFEFTGSGNRIVDSVSAANNFTFRNNIVDDPNASGTSSGVLQFEGSSYNGLDIEFNLLEDQASNPDANMILLGGGASYDGMTIKNNTIDSSTSTMVFYNGNTPLVNAVISLNEFSGLIGGTSGVGSTALNIGTGGNIQITDNYFHDMNYTNFQVGIVGGAVLGNTFANTSSLPGGPFGDAFQLWGGEYGTSVSTNVTIANNVIHFNDVPGAIYPTHGVRLRASGSAAPGIDGTTIHINDNTFINGGVRSDAYAIRDFGDPTKPVDASGNWWSTTDETAISNLMLGPVDFTPYLDSGTDTSANPGFQGDFSSLTVTTLGQQVGSTGRIQEAINLLADGSLTGSARTVNVNSGTYTENDSITKDLSLIGQGPSSTQIDGGSSMGILIGSPATSVTLQGLRVTTSGAALSASGLTTLNLTNIETDGGGTSSISGVTTVNVDQSANSGAETVTASGSSFSETGALPIQATTIDSTVTNLYLTTGAGNDTFNVTAPVSGGTIIHVDGGLPTTPPGDTLNYDATGAPILTVGPSSITATGRQIVYYQHIETVNPNQANVGVTNTSAPNPVIAGTNLTYTVVVSNTGPSIAQTVTFSDPLPANTTLFTVNTPSGWTRTDSTFNGTNGTLTFSASSLAAGASSTFTIVVRVASSVPNGFILSDTATVHTASVEPSPANPASATATTTVNTRADLAVTVTPSLSTVLAGTDLTYTVRVTNNGPSNAQTVNLAGLTVPANTAFISFVGAAGWTSTGVPAVGATSGSINSSITVLAAGASATFTFKVQVSGFTPATALISLTGTATTATTDLVSSNNTATGTSHVTLKGAGLATNLTYPAQVNLIAGGDNLNNTISFVRISGQIGVVIDGVSYGPFSPTGRLVAYGRDGNDRITVDPSIYLPATLYGGNGNDTLIAGSGNTVLVGGDGSDTLTSGTGKNILISGSASLPSMTKTIFGTAGNNIMIGGSTDWDTNDQALGSLLAEWGRNDLPPATSYATRVSQLMNGGGLNGTTKLNSTTVHDNHVRDYLIGLGTTSQNWYLAHITGAGVLDIIVGKKTTETITNI